MSRGARATALLLALAALAFGALVGIGCGDDEDEVTLPTISVEDTSTIAPTETTQQTEGATTPTEQNGGTGTGNIDPNQEDSATNDKPPEPGSPEEAFEQACKENPAACG